MLKNKVVLGLTLSFAILTFGFILGSAGVSSAIEFSSGQIIGQSNIPNNNSGTESYTSEQISATDNAKCGSAVNQIQTKQHEYLNISEVKEIPSSKITVNYNDVNVIIPVAKDAVNIVKVPYPIKLIDSSKFCPDNTPPTAKCIKDVGKSEYQFSIVPLPDIDTDLAVMTSEKTFIITLRPMQKAASYIEIIDAGKKEIRMTDDKEKSLPYVELLVELIQKNSQRGGNRRLQ